MSNEFDPSGYTSSELKDLADKLYEHLKQTRDVDLEEELLEHYHRCKEAADVALKSLLEGRASAGAAAVLTATTGALKELARLQTDMYNAEQLKVFERAVTNVLRDHPDADSLLGKLEKELITHEQN